jgi:hypothetical protein
MYHLRRDAGDRPWPDEEPIEFICNENQQFRRRIKID